MSAENATPTAGQIGKVLGHIKLATTPVSAATDPTDKSTPPVINTIVMPMAEIPTIANVLAMVTILSILRKVGAKAPMTRHIKMNAPSSARVGFTFSLGARAGGETVSCNIIVFVNCNFSEIKTRIDLRPTLATRNSN